MRRALIRTVGGSLLVGVGVLAGFRLGGEVAPRELRAVVQATLSEAFGTDVTVRAARLLVFPGISVEATGLAAWGSPGAPAFTAERIELRLDRAALFSGRLRFSAIAFDGAHLDLVREADGSWTPPLLSPVLENPLVVLGRLFGGTLPAHAIDVRSGSLTLTDTGTARTPEYRARFMLQEVTLRLLSPGLFQPGRLRVSGVLLETKGGRSPFEIEASSSHAGPPQLEVAATGVAIDRLLPYLHGVAPGLEAGGRGSFVLSLSAAAGGGTDLAFDAVAEELRLAGRAREWQQSPITADRLETQGRLRIQGDALTLSDAEVHAGDLTLSLAGSLGRPVSRGARLALDGRLSSLPVPQLRKLGAWLPAEARRAFADGTRSLASGRFDDLTLSGDATVDDWLAPLRSDGSWLPAGARLEGGVADVVVQPAGGEPVTVLRGSASLEGPDLLRVAGLEGKLGDRPLPVLDLRLTGLRHLLAATPVPVPDVPPLPGRDALLELVLGPRDASGGAGWSALDVDADWLLHPAFFRPLRGVKAHLEPTPDGVSLRLAQASWGGIPLHAEGTWSRGDPERVRLSVEAGPAEEEAPRAIPAANWAHGHFALTAPAHEGFHVSSLRGGFDFAGPRLTVFDASATLGMPGRLTGDARVDLSQPGAVPAVLRFSLDDARVAEFLAALSDDPVPSSGSLDLEARLEGPLRPGVPVLTTLEGNGHLTARDGYLGVELPLLLAIAKASTTFDPFGSAHGIRFDRIDAALRIEGGRLLTRQGVTIESPDVRLVLSGSVDLRSAPHALEAVIGCFFFKPLDQLLGVMPVVSRILLGPDRSLFGSFFELTGSWENPEAGLIPTRAVALGPASFLMEDVPAFVKRGFEAIGSVLPKLGGHPPGVASPAASADAAGDGS